jgi:predicted nucleic acid-binding Zn finger protein
MVKSLSIHTLKSFIKRGWCECSTWVGGILLFGWVYHNEIHALIHKILTSDKLSDQLIDTIAHAFDSIATAFATYLVLKTKSKTDE